MPIIKDHITHIAKGSVPVFDAFELLSSLLGDDPESETRKHQVRDLSSCINQYWDAHTDSVRVSIVWYHGEGVFGGEYAVVFCPIVYRYDVESPDGDNETQTSTEIVKDHKDITESMKNVRMTPINLRSCTFHCEGVVDAAIAEIPPTSPPDTLVRKAVTGVMMMKDAAELLEAIEAVEKI